MKTKFYKMQGAGNDFICLDNKNGKLKLTKKVMAKIGDRRFGVGADGILIMEKPKNNQADIFMNFWNADGTPAKMCGNGARCTAIFAKKIWGVKKKKIKISTRDGIKEAEILKDNQVRVNMGKLELKPSSYFPNQPKNFGGVKYHFASTGDPHAVGFYSSASTAQKAFINLAPQIQTDLKNFPKEINVHTIWKKGPNHFAGLSLERKIGQTLACGTGMCSALVVLNERLNKIQKDKKIRIDTLGGTLFFEFNKKNEILMTGPAEFVFEGEIKI